VVVRIDDTAIVRLQNMTEEERIEYCNEKVRQLEEEERKPKAKV